MNLTTLVRPSPSLLFLSRLQMKGAFRSLFSGVFTLPGLYVVMISVSFILPFFVNKSELIHWFSRVFLIFGPLALGFLFFYAVRVGLSGCAFYYSPAETNFLLTAPLTKDELLAYKFQQYHVGAVVTTLTLSLHLTRTSQEFWLLITELYLVLMFLIFVPLVVGSFFGKSRQALANGLRLFVDLLLGAFLLSVVLAILLRLAGHVELSDNAALFFRKLTLPFDVFFRYFASANLEKVKIGILVLLATNLLLLVVFLTRSKYLEIESIFYKNLLQHRTSFNRLRGRLIRPSRMPLGNLPTLPHWQGMGPLLWSKAHEYIRGYRNLAVLFGLLALGFISIVIFFMKSRASLVADTSYLAWNILFTAQSMALLASLFSGFADFRSDGDRIETLKALPIRPWRVVAAYLVWPTFILGGFLMGLLLAGFSIVHHYFPLYPVEKGLLVSLLLAGPTAFAILGVGNLCFLLFPVQSELKGKLIGKAIVQFSTQVLFNVAIAFALGWLQNEAMFQADKLTRPFLGFGVGMFLVLTSAGILLFFLLSYRFKTFNVTRLAQ